MKYTEFHDVQTEAIQFRAVNKKQNLCGCPTGTQTSPHPNKLINDLC